MVLFAFCFFAISLASLIVLISFHLMFLGQPPSAFWNCIITSEFKSVDTSEYALAKVEIAKYGIKRNLAMYKFL